MLRPRKGAGHYTIQQRLVNSQQNLCLNSTLYFDIVFLELIEEEEAFQNFHSDRRQFSSGATSGMSSSATMQRRRTEDPDAERRNKIRSNFSRLVKQNYRVYWHQWETLLQNCVFICLHNGTTFLRAVPYSMWELVNYFISTHENTCREHMPCNKGFFLSHVLYR